VRGCISSGLLVVICWSFSLSSLKSRILRLSSELPRRGPGCAPHPALQLEAVVGQPLGDPLLEVQEVIDDLRILGADDPRARLLAGHDALVDRPDARASKMKVHRGVAADGPMFAWHWIPYARASFMPGAPGSTSQMCLVTTSGILSRVSRMAVRPCRPYDGDAVLFHFPRCDVPKDTKNDAQYCL